MMRPRGRPRTLPPHRAVNVRMPADIMERLDALRAEHGLSYSDAIIAALRRQFGLPAPADQIFGARE